MDTKVIIWLKGRLEKFNIRFAQNYTAEQYITELRAIADEAEMRLKNPNFPASDIEF